MPEITSREVVAAAEEMLEVAVKEALAPKKEKRKVATKKTLQECLSETMREVGYVQKDARNDFHKYKYASAEAVLKKVNASLSANGICLSNQVDLVRFEDNLAIVKLSLTFHKGAESYTVEGLGSGSDKGDKAVMKAHTASLKYALAAAFLISWGDDPEADEETDRRAAGKSAPKPTGKPRQRAAARAPSLPPVEGLLLRIEAHRTPKSLIDDKALLEDLKKHEGQPTLPKLREAWMEHEKTLKLGDSQ